MTLGHFLTPHTKINSKWMKDLNVRPEPIKFLEENIGSNFFHTSHRNVFLEMCPEAKETKAKLNYWDYLKIKNSAQQRTLSTKLKDHLLNGRRYLQMI